MRKLTRADRRRIRMLKFKKRCKNLGLEPDTKIYHAYLSHGKPCSCWACRHEKYKRTADEPPFLNEED